MNDSLKLFRQSVKQARDLLWMISGQAHSDPDFPLDRQAVLAEYDQAMAAIGRIQRIEGFGGAVGLEDA